MAGIEDCARRLRRALGEASVVYELNWAFIFSRSTKTTTLRLLDKVSRPVSGVGCEFPRRRTAVALG